MNINIAKNYSYPDFSNLSQDILEQKFRVTKEEKEFVNAREKHNRLGFAVLVKTFNYLGYFVTDLNKIPMSIVTNLAIQLNLDVETIKRYNKLASVKKFHVQQRLIFCILPPSYSCKYEHRIFAPSLWHSSPSFSSTLHRHAISKLPYSLLYNPPSLQ